MKRSLILFVLAVMVLAGAIYLESRGPSECESRAAAETVSQRRKDTLYLCEQNKKM